MSDCFVSVNGKHLICEVKTLVNGSKKEDTVRFDLTEKGCMDAGRFLAKNGIQSWSCSSSVDFPQESDPDFDHDVHELMQKGYQDETKNKFRQVTIKQLAEQLGVEYAVVAAVVKLAVATNQAKEVGKQKAENSKGKAATVYEIPEKFVFDLKVA